MLNIIRMNARGWIIKTMLFSIVLVFMFWGIGNFKSKTLKKIATVNGESISFKEYSRLYWDLIEEYDKDIVNSKHNTDQYFKNFVLSQIIDHKLILQQAIKFGLKITDKELIQYIQSNPLFLDYNNTFDIGQYKNNVSKLGFTLREFEEYNKELLLIKKFISTVCEMVSVSETELLNWYDWYYSLINLSYVFFDFDNYTVDTYNKEDIYKYFEQNKQKYETPLMNKIRYLTFNPNNYLDKINIDESEILEYYNSHISDFFEEKRINVSHILIGSDSSSQLKNQKNKAQNIFEMLIKEDNFDNLAKLYSDCPSKKYGGLLGDITYNSVESSFAEKAFSMSVGEISSPIKTKFGWHIIKINSIQEAREIPLSESKNKIKNILSKLKADDYAYQNATNFLKDCYGGNDLIDNAKLYDDINLIETDWFESEEDIIKFGEDKSLMMSIISSMKIGEISNVHKLNDCYSILQIIDKINPKIPDFDNIKAEVINDFKACNKILKTHSDAESFLALVRSGKSFKEVSKMYELLPSFTGFITRKELLTNKNKYSKNILLEKVIELFEAEDFLLDKPISTKKGIYVVWIAEKKEPKSIKSKEILSFKKQIKNIKQSKLLMDLISELRKTSKIEIAYNL